VAGFGHVTDDPGAPVGVDRLPLPVAAHDLVESVGVGVEAFDGLWIVGQQSLIRDEGVAVEPQQCGGGVDPLLQVVLGDAGCAQAGALLVADVLEVRDDRVGDLARAAEHGPAVP
jgi:hypothetical protein